MVLPEFIKGGNDPLDESKEKEKVDRLSKKKRMKKSATAAKDLKQFRFAIKRGL